MSEPVWQKNSLATHIFFDLCLFKPFCPVASFEQQSIDTSIKMRIIHFLIVKKLWFSRDTSPYHCSSWSSMREFFFVYLTNIHDNFSMPNPSMSRIMDNAYYIWVMPLASSSAGSTAGALAIAAIIAANRKRSMFVYLKYV